MLYWRGPFPMWDATYVFTVFPRKKTSGDPGTERAGAMADLGPRQRLHDGTEVVWDRWYTQGFRARRESPSITHHGLLRLA